MPAVKILLCNPEGKIINYGVTEHSSEESSPDCYHERANTRSQSLPNLNTIGYFFNKWKWQTEQKRTLSGTEWTQKLTSPDTLDKMAEGLQKRNSVLEDSFMMEFEWRERNKSTSY